jgi:RNA polymerase sigma factor for flagellar operon FliA
MSHLNAVLSQLQSEFEADPVYARGELPTTQVDAWWATLGPRAVGKVLTPEAREARGRLITHFAPLVTVVATRIVVRLPDTVELGDLVSYGMFGLIDAVERFEPERGFKFETYAATRIRGAIIDELRAADWVPRSVRSKARAVEKATRESEQRVHGPVSDDDVAASLGWQVSEVRSVRAQVTLAHVAALDGLPSNRTHLQELVPQSLHAPCASAPLERQETFVLLREALEHIRGRDQEVLRLYYFENLTLGQIGKVLGVTESRVSQIHTGAVGKLREALLATGAFD